MCEFGGAEDGGDPEGFFGASLEGQVGRQVRAAVEVLLTAGQTEVQALVTEGGVFITLVVGDKRGKKIRLLRFSSSCIEHNVMAVHFHGMSVLC